MSIVNRPINKSQLKTLSASLAANSPLHLDIRAAKLAVELGIPGIASPEARARVDEAHASCPAPPPKVWVATASMHDNVQLASAGAGLVFASYCTRSGAYARSSALPWKDAEKWLRSEGVVVTSNWALLGS